MNELRALLGRIYLPDGVERWIAARGSFDIAAECAALRRWLAAR